MRVNGDRDASEDVALASSGGGEGEGLALERDGMMMREPRRSTCLVGTTSTSRAGAGAAVDVVWVDPPNGTLAVPSEREDGSCESQSARNGVDGGSAEGEDDVADVQLCHPSDVGHVTPIPPSFFEGYITTSRPYPTGGSSFLPHPSHSPLLLRCNKLWNTHAASSPVDVQCNQRLRAHTASPCCMRGRR